jgi:lycopene cyclase domain-containing protein
VFLYAPRYISGIYLGTIPLEDLMFGMEFVTAVIIMWEFRRRRPPPT